MAEMELRDILELAREFRVRRLRVGDIEVEMPLEGPVPEGFGDPRPRLPTEAEIRLEQSNAGLFHVPDQYRKAFGGALPRFEDLSKSK